MITSTKRPKPVVLCILDGWGHRPQHDHNAVEQAKTPTWHAMMRDCLAHADDLRRQGRLLDTQMLAGAEAARTVRSRGGRQTIVDGPFTETKELLAGFNLIEAEDLDAALKLMPRRRGGGMPQSQSDRDDRRRQRDVHHTVAVDHGTR